MGWGDVDKGPLGQTTGRFLQLEDGETKTVRLLDEEPHSAYVHKISQIVRGEEVYRSIPATEDLDDNFIQNNSRRWPAMPQHGMRCIQVEEGEAVGEILVLMGGKKIFGDLKAIYDRHGDLSKFDIEIGRTGKGRETSYAVTLAPVHAQLDIEGLRAEIEADESLQWGAIFPKVTGDEQRRMLAEAGMSIEYDPAEEIAGEMDIDDALAARMTHGKYKGKTLRELVVVDAGYLAWAAENFTSNDEIAAACRVVTRNMDRVVTAGKGQKALPAGGAGSKGTASTRKSPESKETAKVGAKTAEREALVGEINQVLSNDPRFEDAMEIARVIGEAGNGKTRMRDLSVAELQALKEIVGSGEAASAPATAGRRRPASKG